MTMQTDLRPSTRRAERSALVLYSRSLRDCAPLSCDEEHDVAVRFFETRDPALAERLVAANLRLVAKICHAYQRSRPTLLDLIQEGNLGLVLAVQKFDPHRGVRLSTYAGFWIRAFVLRFIVADHRLVKVGTTRVQRKLFFNLGKEKRKLERAGVPADSKLLAAALGVPERDVIEMDIRLAHADGSLDAPVDAGGESGSAMVDFIPDLESRRPDVQTEHREFFGILAAGLTAFRTAMKEPREIDLFDERLTAEAPATLQDLAARHGVSGERMRQIEGGLKSKLRVFLQQAFGEPEGRSDVAGAPSWT